MEISVIKLNLYYFVWACSFTIIILLNAAMFGSPWIELGGLSQVFNE